MAHRGKELEAQKNTMTAPQKIKHMILLKAAEWMGVTPPQVTAENIDDLYDGAVESDDGTVHDARNEIRCCGQETGLPCESSRYYETEAVAAQAPDGSWVGWTYYSGGGKHGEPQSMPWIEHAYDLACTEEVKTVTVRSFAKVPA